MPSEAQGDAVLLMPYYAQEPTLVHISDDPPPNVDAGDGQDAATSYARLENAFDRIDPYNPPVGPPGGEWVGTSPGVV